MGTKYHSDTRLISRPMTSGISSAQSVRGVPSWVRTPQAEWRVWEKCTRDIRSWKSGSESRRAQMLNSDWAWDPSRVSFAQSIRKPGLCAQSRQVLGGRAALIAQQIVKHRFVNNPQALKLFRREIDICSSLEHVSLRKSCRLMSGKYMPLDRIL